MTRVLVFTAVCFVALAGSLIPGPEPEAAAGIVTGTASWFCGHGSACTKGYTGSDLIAAADPTTGWGKGDRLRVTSDGAVVVVTVRDVCACPGARILDLSSGAFQRLAPLSVGLVRVAVERVEAVPTLPPTDTE